MKQYLLALLLFTSIYSFGQSSIESKNELSKIDSVNQLKQWSANHPQWIIDFYEIEKDSIQKDSQLHEMKVGDIATVQSGNNTYTYKLLETDTLSEFRADHIYLDGRILSLNQIDSLQKIIIYKYNEGESFKDLVKTYTMYPNKTNYFSGWFKPGMMILEFENAVKNHQKNAIFSLDVNSRKWHYVVLKTHENKETIKLKLVRITNQL